MNDNDNKNKDMIRVPDLPEILTLPNGNKVSRESAEARIEAEYGEPRVGYVLPVTGNGRTLYAAAVPTVDRDTDGEWERDGWRMSWHETFKGASRLVKSGYKALDKIQNFEEEEYWIGENEEDDDDIEYGYAA